MIPRSLIIGLFFTLLLTSQNVYAEQVSSNKKYYDTGEIKSEGNKFQGLFKQYYKNGKFAYEGEYTLGKPKKSYDKTGRVAFEAYFQKGEILPKENGK